MNDIPTPSGRRRILTRIVWIAWAAGVLVTAVGFTAPWVPLFDAINAARPLIAALAVVLFVVALASRERALLRPTLGLALLQVVLVTLPWARTADSAPNAPPALRLVTFDLGTGNDRFDDIADFILGAGADLVLLQEVSCSAADQLMPKLHASFTNAYASADGCDGQAILSKRPWMSVGQVVTAARKPLVISATFQWGKSVFALSGVSLAGPSAPREQATDIERLRGLLATQGGAQIVAGAFNLTPFAWKFAQLEAAGLGQHATYLATWRATWPVPLLLMDNVLSTDGIASVRTRTGPALGSDHLPLIADIAFTK